MIVDRGLRVEETPNGLHTRKLIQIFISCPHRACERAGEAAKAPESNACLPLGIQAANCSAASATMALVPVASDGRCFTFYLCSTRVFSEFHDLCVLGQANCK